LFFLDGSVGFGKGRIIRSPRRGVVTCLYQYIGRGARLSPTCSKHTTERVTPSVRLLIEDALSDNLMIVIRGVAHDDDSKSVVRIKTHDVEESASAAQVLDVSGLPASG